MPELPEVESIKLQLNKYVVGHVIKNVDVRYKKCFSGDPGDITGAKFKKIRRFGKALVMDLDNGFSIIIHIKMTGQLIYRGPNLKNSPDISEKVRDGLEGKHTHVIFDLDKGGKLYYNDVRKFGWIHVHRTSEVKNHKFIKNLGPEFLDNLTPENFNKKVKSSSRSIKTLLMDQGSVSGVGNIYANDALNLAKISPVRSAKKLSDKEIARLYEAVETVLKKALKLGGASENAYVRPDGTDGSYQNHTRVYGRSGESCPNCGGIIEKTKTSGRGTYWCPRCQK
jgi:formamidopyrimidine-DNA glycosylase